MPIELELALREEEYWWGGAVADGIRMPYGSEACRISLNPNLSANQAAPLLLSSKGRYVWNDEPVSFSFAGGKLRMSSDGNPFEVGEHGGNLREAYLAAASRHFPPSGKMPPDVMFRLPQYNTWIELMYDQCEDRIIQYAEAVISHGMPPGLLMIDDNWQEDYGSWTFHPGRFRDPARMMERMHQLGFQVMLWVCPFISADSLIYRTLRSKGYLIRNPDGSPAIRKWWNGYSAMLDISHPEAAEWLAEQLDRLQADYGVDGFKFDAGDPEFYRADDRCAEPTHANGQAERWARFGLRYPLNEYRACWKGGLWPLAQRLSDKNHSWGSDGLGSLIPNGLAQGLLGYPFTCPDMIGGGEYLNFAAHSGQLDPELFVRYAQCAALFPMMQFSAAPWRVLDHEHFEYCRQTALLHVGMGDTIVKLARHAAVTGEPILRHMAYAFPDGGFERVTDQFMLGDHILAAPVLQHGQYKRQIHFPEGDWLGDDGTGVKGPCVRTVPAPLSRLPWYRRIAAKML